MTALEKPVTRICPSLVCLLAIGSVAGLGCARAEPPVRAVAEEAEHEGHAHAEPAAEPEVAANPDMVTLEDGSRLFGAALTEGREALPLATISATPEAYADQVVRTTGTISQVCQAMGCWMELTAEGAAPIRVPMAGHAFFLPRDVVGHTAEIEGRVMLVALSEGMRRHLEAEGATATGSALSIEATGVVVR